MYLILLNEQVCATDPASQPVCRGQRNLTLRPVSQCAICRPPRHTHAGLDLARDKFVGTRRPSRGAHPTEFRKHQLSTCSLAHHTTTWNLAVPSTTNLRDLRLTGRIWKQLLDHQFSDTPRERLP